MTRLHCSIVQFWYFLANANLEARCFGRNSGFFLRIRALSPLLCKDLLTVSTLIETRLEFIRWFLASTAVKSFSDLTRRAISRLWRKEVWMVGQFSAQVVGLDVVYAIYKWLFCWRQFVLKYHELCFRNWARTRLDVWDWQEASSSWYFDKVWSQSRSICTFNLGGEFPILTIKLNLEVLFIRIGNLRLILFWAENNK